LGVGAEAEMSEDEVVTGASSLGVGAVKRVSESELVSGVGVGVGAWQLVELWCGTI
jgi:hypothetical protein